MLKVQIKKIFNEVFEYAIIHNNTLIESGRQTCEVIMDSIEKYTQKYNCQAIIREWL